MFGAVDIYQKMLIILVSVMFCIYWLVYFFYRKREIRAICLRSIGGIGIWWLLYMFVYQAKFDANLIYILFLVSGTLVTLVPLVWLFKTYRHRL